MQEGFQRHVFGHESHLFMRYAVVQGLTTRLIFERARVRAYVYVCVFVGRGRKDGDEAF